MENKCNLIKCDSILKIDAECIITNLCKIPNETLTNNFLSIALPLIISFLLKFSYDLYNEKKEISGDISAIQSDVSTSIEILQKMKIIENFIDAFNNPENRHKYIWVDEPRKENYFLIHEALAQKIGRMPEKRIRPANTPTQPVNELG